MRRMLACLAALIFASQLGATASAAEPPSSCLSAPNQVCLLEWAWQEAIAAPANGSAATGNQDPRRLSETIMTELLALNPGSELIGVVLGLPDGLQRSDWLVRIAAPSIADLPEYKQAIQSSLHAATPTAFLSNENFRVWASLVGVAARIGLTDEARSALRQISDSDRAQIKASEARSRALIAAALTLKDYGAVRDFVGMSSDPAAAQRYSNLRTWWQNDPSIANLDEFKRAVLEGLGSATDLLLRGRQQSNWAQFITFADDIGLASEARNAFQRALVFLRSDIPDNDNTTERRVQGVIALALQLKDYAVVSEWLGRLPSSPRDWRSRILTLKTWWKTSPAIAKLPEFTDMIGFGLQSTTDRLPSGEVFDFGTWIGMVGLASNVGLVDLAKAATQRAASAVGPGAAAGSEGNDKIAIVIRAAAMLGDSDLAKRLADQLTGKSQIEALAMIAYAAKHPGEDPGMQGSDKSAFDTLLGRHEYRLAMEIAVSPADYANIALLAAIAKDTVTASSAIELFQRLSVLSPLVTKDASVACELKAGFVHVLLDDGVDVAPLIKDADEWLQAASSRLEMGAMLYWWDIVALKMVSHPQQPIKSFLDNNAELASPADQLFALSGGAAVAFGVGGDIALPLIQESMMLLAQAPDPLVRTYTLEFMARILGAHSTTTGCR